MTSVEDMSHCRAMTHLVFGSLVADVVDDRGEWVALVATFLHRALGMVALDGHGDSIPLRCSALTVVKGRRWVALQNF